MAYNVIPTDFFKKEAKRLIKKFPSLKDELQKLAILLADKPTSGDDLGNNMYKVRIGIKSKGKGKKGGGRIITYVIAKDKEVYLLTIFDKSEFETIDNKILKSIIDKIL
jgi:hypothetical protein